MSKPPIGLLSEKKLRAMAIVLTANRDLGDAIEAVGVSREDIMIALGYAQNWVRMHSKGVAVTLPDEVL